MLAVHSGLMFVVAPSVRRLIPTVHGRCRLAQ